MKNSRVIKSLKKDYKNTPAPLFRQNGNEFAIAKKEAFESSKKYTFDMQTLRLHLTPARRFAKKVY